MGSNVNTHVVQRRRRVDELKDRVQELEAKLAAIESFTADDPSLADELTTIYELLPRFREEMREELEKRAKHSRAVDRTS